MNILPSIVDGYMFNEMIDTMDDTKTMSGGYPLSKLVGEMEFISQSGGSAHRETPSLARLGNLAVPIGLVYKPQKSSVSQLKYGDASILDDGVINGLLYDKLVELVSPHTHNKTRKLQNKGDGANRTYRNRK